MRPFAGRPPSRGGIRGEKEREPIGKGSLTPPEKREGKKRASRDGLCDGEHMLPHACSRIHAGNRPGEADDSRGRTSQRGTSATGQDDEESLPADLHVRSENRLEDALRNQENSGVGQGRKESVRMIAEDFVGNVLNDLSPSPSHATIYSLALK